RHRAGSSRSCESSGSRERSSSRAARPTMSSEHIVSYAFPQLETPPGGGSSPGDLLADAWAEAGSIREQARQEGHAEGHAAGVAGARAEIDATISALAGSLEQVEELREELVAALEHD